MTKKRSSFTLLEVMICLVIIGMVGSLIGIKGIDLWRYHQFRSSTQIFVDDLTHWRLLSLTYDCDVTCKIQKVASVYTVSWKPDTPLKQQGRASSYTLTGVKELLCDGKPIDALECTLFSSGRLSQKGILSFIPSHHDKGVYLDLLYPIKLQQSEKAAKHSVFPPAYPEKAKEQWSTQKATGFLALRGEGQTGN